MEHDSSEQVDPLVGRKFGGKYTIVEKLGSGGMGGVYKAQQEVMNRFVAIKILRSTFHGDDVQMRRFQQEARTLSQLSHPNAVVVFDFGVEDGLPYLVMEYIEGRTLKVVIREEKRLPLQRVQAILRQACAALSEAHRLGIVHRDIKPDNIMIRPHHDGTDWVKVLDFGVAKSVLGNDPNLTQAGVLVGTPQYMCPEQCKGSELDARADIYSLGVVLYEMLSGEVPFQAPSVLELLMKVLSSEPEPLRKFKAVLTLPPAIDDVVLKSLAKDPALRFQTMAEFFAGFEKAMPRSAGNRGSGNEPISWRALGAMGIVGMLVALTLFLAIDRMPGGKGGSSDGEQRAMEAAKTAAIEKKKAEDEAARLKADAAIREAQAWQTEQERAKLDEQQQKERAQLEEERQRLEKVRHEDAEKAAAMQRELDKVRQQQAEMEIKVRESEKKQQQQVTEKLEAERKKVAEEAADKQRELEQKLEQAKKSKDDVERAAQNRAKELARQEIQRQEALKRQAEQPVHRPSTPAPTAMPTAVVIQKQQEPIEEKKAPRRRCGPTWCD